MLVVEYTELGSGRAESLVLTTLRYSSLVMKPHVLCTGKAFVPLGT